VNSGTTRHHLPQEMNTSQFAILATLTLSPLLHAEEGGGGHSAPGSASTMADLPPTKAGWVINPMYLYYDGSSEGSSRLPVAGLTTLNIDATSQSFMLGGTYTFPEKLWDAWFTVGAYLPYMWTEVNASVRTLDTNVYATDRTEGIGDMVIVPAMLAWKCDNWQYNAFLKVYAPTGDFDEGSLANAGLNYWTFEPTVGVSYSNPETGFNWALHGGVTFNTENSDTNYQSGSVIHLDASAQQMLPLGPGLLTLGLNGFYYEQVSGDSGSGATLGGFEGRSLGVGPVVGYILPMGDDTLLVEARWVPELDTSNRIEGDYFWLKVAWQF